MIFENVKVISNLILKEKDMWKSKTKNYEKKMLKEKNSRKLNFFQKSFLSPYYHYVEKSFFFSIKNRIKSNYYMFTYSKRIARELY